MGLCQRIDDCGGVAFARQFLNSSQKSIFANAVPSALLLRHSYRVKFSILKQTPSHVGLGKNKTPVMAIGLYHRPLSMLELLSLRGFHSLTI